MAMKKQYGTYLLNDGTEHGPFHVKIQTKIQFEKTAKARKWDAEDDPNQSAAFMTWHASKLSGEHSMSFDEFMESIDDVYFQFTDEDVTGDSPNLSNPDPTDAP
ncbi:hypothetical protein [Glutamicibacter halophytocola]|uniref:hypothetical protein n=1 Tax=Glutamicibacter halophytocola TaxID=1933880 RepID=UPI0015C52921|nr:hypothetical protein [Glutamicibacter halophytocola]NQD40914.1 hypothetical protein [Glutamicibacter halophytocola]